MIQLGSGTYRCHCICCCKRPCRIVEDLDKGVSSCRLEHCRAMYEREIHTSAVERVRLTFFEITDTVSNGNGCHPSHCTVDRGCPHHTSRERVCSIFQFFRHVNRSISTKHRNNRRLHANQCRKPSTAPSRVAKGGPSKFRG